MCMQNTKEGCVLREQLQGVKADVGSVKADVGAPYSRALTAAEIAANYAIDKERFNLP